MVLGQLQQAFARVFFSQTQNGIVWRACELASLFE